MQPVAMPSVEKGMNARVSLFDHRAALAKANSRLRASRGWYEGVRKSYGAKE